ncbi:MAG: fibronectin type III domain-containing protein [Nitrosarchaeum sp.]|nr:fibronectin type III domain-containing protein [Nitrosarchaeum sp.]MCV0398404.1 fibronectin type III domain-containing protein [Nitrosarchaeum sp.]
MIFLKISFTLIILCTTFLFSQVVEAAKPIEGIPDKVTNLSATATSTSQIDLSWSEPNNNGSPITGYQIERRIQGTWMIIVSNTADNETNYSDAGLATDTRYSYRVSAINSAGIGPASSPATEATFAASTVPTKPRALTAISGDAFVTLSWKEPVSDGGEAIFDYVIEYSADNGSTWTSFDDGTSTNTIATITNLKNYILYLFRVSAVNSIGIGPYSEVQAMPQGTISTNGSYERHPPEILGVGFYHINTERVSNPYSKVTLGLEIDDAGRFHDFIPYSQYSDEIDMKKFKNFANYDKHGQYVSLDGNSIIPTFLAEIGKPVQIQIRFIDQYASSKIEHIGLYIGKSEDSSSYDPKILWNKGQPLDVIDKNNVISSASVNTSLEDGWYWAIIDVVFDKEISESDIIIETWNEQRKPATKILKDSIQVVRNIEFTQDDRPSLRVDVSVNHDTSSPVCKASGTCFTPHNAQILQGGIVSWINNDVFMHDIESGVPGKKDNRFDEHIIPGNMAQRKFEQPGVYKYFCSMHPWATGIITVVSNDSKFEKIEYDETKPALLVASVSSSGSIMIENKETIVIPNKDLKVEISGHIQEKRGSQPILLSVIRPDGSSEEIRTATNERGYYFVPTVLDKKWQSGKYTVIASYKNTEIASIEFSIDDNVKGFGGKLFNITDELKNKIKSYYENEISIGSFENWMVKSNIEPKIKDYLINRVKLFEHIKFE